MKQFSLPIRVYIEDTDAGGIVYYVNYLKFMERARTEFVRHFIFEQSSLLRDRILFVVHSCNMRFLNPARVDDELVVTAEVIKLGKANMVFGQSVKRADNSLSLCEGDVKIACINANTMKPCAIPEGLYNAVKSVM